MTALISLLPIFGFAAIFKIYFKKNVSVSIFFSITFIITTLYIFGMLEFLKIGSYLLFYGGIALVIYMGLTFKDKLFLSIKSVPFVLFVFMSTVYLFFMKDAQFFFWDEYSHWGQFIKDMYNFNSFYGVNTHITHSMYPPGISTWDYFIVKNSFFSDGNIYFAYFLLLFSSTLMMYEKLTFKDLHWIVLVFAIQMILYADFGHWFSCIYVDHVIGAMFAGVVLSYLSDNFKSKELLLFVFPLISMVLVKEIGLYFGLSFLGLVLLHEITKSKLDNKKTLLVNIKQHNKTILILFVLFVSTVMALKVWDYRQESLGVQKEHQTISGVVSSLLSNKKVLDGKTEIEVKKRFWKVVNDQQLHKEKVSLNYNEFSYGIMSKFKKSIKLTTTGSMLFFALMFLALFFMIKNKATRTRVTLIYSYILFVTVVYLFILYFSFLVAFGNDALRIPSYVRYMNMGILPMYFIGFALMLPMFAKMQQIESKDNSNKNLFFLALSIAMLLGFITKPYFKPLYSQLNNSFRTISDKITRPIVKSIAPKSKLFVIFPIRNNGSLNNILKYSLIPLDATISKYDFEKKSFQEMLNIYSKYEYIWFVQLDKNLVNKNRVFLKGKANKQAYSLYKIEKSKNNIKILSVL